MLTLPHIITTSIIPCCIVVFLALQPFWLYFHSPVGGFSLLAFQGFLITHYDAPQSVGLPWTSDQSVAETSTWQHTTLTTDKHPCPPWDSNPQSQQASCRRRHWDRHIIPILCLILNHVVISKYLSRSITRALFVRINIFLQTVASFVFSHFVFKYSVLHFVVFWTAQQSRLTYVDTYAKRTRRIVDKKGREMRNKFRKECEK